MRRPLTVLLSACMACAGWQCRAEDLLPALRHRTVSRTHQFIVFADDANARAAIAMDAEDVKEKFLELISARDDWKNPILIELTPLNTAEASQPSSTVRVLDTEEGFKVELDIVLGSDPREAHFPQQLVRALLLEFAYRNQPALVRPGMTYAEPPAWLVDGIASMAADPDPDANAGLFRSLIQSGKTPTLASLLAENPATLDGTSLKLYSACSMSLVRLLTELPNGHVLLQGLIRHWPGANADPEVELLKAYPALNSGEGSLEKWWSLGLANLSASDRYQGLSLEETSSQLDGMLTFEVAMDKAGKTKEFTLDQYPAFASAPGRTPALNKLSEQLLGLEAQANPLMREVVGAYQELAVLVLHHQAHHVKAHMAALADYRTRLTTHMEQIADYLNWYEATQTKQQSNSFNDYLKTADSADKDSRVPRSDPISQYMDSFEREMGQ